MMVEMVTHTGDETGEGPVWDYDARRLWWTDIPGKRLHCLDPSTGSLTTHAMPGRVGSFALRQAGGLVLAMEHGFSVWDPDTDRIEVIAQPEAHLLSHRFNDGRCDREGRFLAGSMNLARDAASARLWQLASDWVVHDIADDCTIANGLAFSPDGKTMYWVDGGRGAVFRFDYVEGRAINRRLWIEAGSASGKPDGAAIDAEGCYWSGRWGGSSVVRFTPEGKVDRIVDLPASRVTMCAFGGADLRTMYITTAWEGMSEGQRHAEPLAGALFAIELDVPGLPEPRFAG